MTGGASGKPPGGWRYDLAGAEADYPAWDGPPRETLLICTQKRSGSTLLGEALYHSGGLGCALEYFHGAFREDLAARWGAPDLAAYVAALWRWRTDPSGALAVKLFWGDVMALAEELAPGRFEGLAQAEPGQVDESFYREIHALLAPIFPNPRHVRLTRVDGIAQAVSHSVAKQRRRWRHIREEDTANQREVAFRFQGIAVSLARIQRHDAHWARYCEANAIAPYPLTYEALAADLPGETNRLREALGAPVADIPPPRMRKQGDARSEELAAAFRAQFKGMTGKG